MEDVNNPPAGGFEEGGWYWDPSIGEARQYSNGGFGAGSTINNKEQVGYGERVSDEVQAQSGYVAPKNTNNSSAAFSGQSLFTPSNNNGGGLNLQAQYDSLYGDLGIDDLQKESESKKNELIKRKKAKAAAEAINNENPFLAEATRVGKISKINEKFNDEALVLSEEQANIDNKVANAYNNLSTRLGLITTQYDLNRTSRADAITQLDNYLALGMLDNAGESDIAVLSSQTGIPLSLINNAIANRKRAITPTTVDTSFIGNFYNPGGTGQLSPMAEITDPDLIVVADP